MKSPAFQFYPNDFLGSGSVAAMTLEEVGAYALLLCYEWNEGGLPDDMERMARWCRVSPRRFTALWKIVGENFALREGRWFNNRLEAERAKQEAWREKSSKGGKTKRQAKANHPSDVVATISEPEANTPFASSTSVTTTTTAARRRADKSAPWMGGVRDAVTSAFDGAFPKEKLWARALRPKYGTLPDEEFFAEIAAYCAGVDDPGFVNPTLCAECMGTWRQRRAEKSERVVPFRRAGSANGHPQRASNLTSDAIDWS